MTDDPGLSKTPTWLLVALFLMLLPLTVLHAAWDASYDVGNELERRFGDD